MHFKVCLNALELCITRLPWCRHLFTLKHRGIRDEWLDTYPIIAGSLADFAHVRICSLVQWHR